MLRALEIYGADRSAFVEDGPFAMGSHLLRLLPEDQWDHQPLRPGDSKGRLVADARIDNRETLARELDISAGAAAELADSDFVMKAWERWGEDSVKHLIGAFAFAVWQPEKKRLFIARDPIGERPLYFCQVGGLFAFASMPGGLLTLPGVDMSLDEEMLALYVALLPQPPGRTLFRHIQKVAQGHSMTITPGGVTQRQYWKIGDTRALRLPNDAEYLEAFRQCFDEAVRCRLRTTGGIGTELSGGLDSSSGNGDGGHAAEKRRPWPDSIHACSSSRRCSAEYTQPLWRRRAVRREGGGHAPEHRARAGAQWWSSHHGLACKACRDG